MMQSMAHIKESVQRQCARAVAQTFACFALVSAAAAEPAAPSFVYFGEKANQKLDRNAYLKEQEKLETGSIKPRPPRRGKMPTVLRGGVDEAQLKPLAPPPTGTQSRPAGGPPPDLIAPSGPDGQGPPPGMTPPDMLAPLPDGQKPPLRY